MPSDTTEPAELNLKPGAPFHAAVLVGRRKQALLNVACFADSEENPVLGYRGVDGKYMSPRIAMFLALLWKDDSYAQPVLNKEKFGKRLRCSVRTIERYVRWLATERFIELVANSRYTVLWNPAMEPWLAPWVRKTSALAKPGPRPVPVEQPGEVCNTCGGIGTHGEGADCRFCPCEEGHRQRARNWAVADLSPIRRNEIEAALAFESRRPPATAAGPPAAMEKRA